jgi:hypothetical protein
VVALMAAAFPGLPGEEIARAVGAA